MNSRLETAGEWLLRLREDRLSPAQMSEWIAWCEADPRNLEAFEELQALWRAANEHAPVARPGAMAGVGRRPRRRLIAVMAAAALIVAVAAPFTLQRVQFSPALSAADSMQTPVATNGHARLPDGSRVDLGARSALEVRFTADSRQLLLRDGQAFFQVEPDAARPFIVEAGEVRIVAIGTAFDVRRTARQVTVTVQEGVVEAGNAGAARVRAAAGAQLVFDAHTGTVHESPVDPAVALAWRAGRLEFIGDRLDVVIASVNRYSTRPVVLADSRLGALAFTGTVFVESIDASLQALEQVFPVSVRHEPDVILITARPEPS